MDTQPAVVVIQITVAEVGQQRSSCRNTRFHHDRGCGGNSPSRPRSARKVGRSSQLTRPRLMHCRRGGFARLAAPPVPGSREGEAADHAFEADDTPGSSLNAEVSGGSHEAPDLLKGGSVFETAGTRSKGKATRPSRVSVFKSGSGSSSACLWTTGQTPLRR